MRRKAMDRGFALAALIFFLTAASILIAAAVPYYQMQGKRIQEEELIFRGEEYMRAILKYQRKTGRYPPSLDALMDTNGIRFLRHEYTDPMTGKAFRLIYINPDGSVTGSVLFGTPQSPFGSSGATGASGMTGASGQSGQAPFKVGGFAGQQTPFGSTGATGATGPTGFGSQQPNSGTAAPNGAAGIIGVASDSKNDSVKVYNNRQKYNEWEFIAILNQPGQGQPGAPGMTGVPGAPGTTGQPGQPGQPGSTGFGFGQPQTQPVQPFKTP